jgi:hypothetical protein
MPDISGFGLTATVVASNTFPTGFDVTEFADDGDPFDLPELKIGEGKMGLNGDLITWSVASPTEINLAVIPNSPADINLAILFDANRVGAGKIPANDVISITGVYPDGSTVNVTNGKMTAGMPGNSVQSAGRLKTKTYKFTFENVTRNQVV